MKYIKYLFSFLFGSFVPSMMAQQLASCVVTSYVEHNELKNGKLLQIDTVILQINSRAGEQYTNVQIPFSPQKKISGLKVWIEDVRGSLIRILEPNEIGEQSLVAGSVLYQDDLMKTFRAKHNIYPYRVCYTYKYTMTQFLDVAAWSPCVQPGLTTLEARLYVHVPRDMDCNLFARKVTLAQADTSATVCSYAFHGTYEATAATELFAESATRTVPVVYVAPKKFKYGISGSYESWKSFGDWIHELNKATDDLPTSERTIAQEVVKGIAAPMEQVRALYHYMQDHTRYINVFIGIGGLQSYPASYVAKNKYGDCKALTYYMKALLATVGIESHVVVLYGSIQPDSLEEQFVHSQFNHMVLGVPLGTDTVWLETTSSTYPFGYVGPFIQNRKGLWIEQGKSHIVHIPPLKASQTSVTRVLRIQVTGSTEANIDFRLSIPSVQELRAHRVTIEEIQQLMSASLGLEQATLSEGHLVQQQRDAQDVQLQGALKAPNFAKKLAQECYFNAFPLAKLTFETPPKRHTHLQLPAPVVEIDSVHYILPNGYEVKTLPPAVDLATPYGRYLFLIRQEGEHIYVVKKMELYPQWYPETSYVDFYHFYQSVKDAERKSIFVLKRKP